MRRLFSCVILALFPILAVGQLKKNIDLLDNWQDNSLINNTSLVRYNDCWGFTKDGSEYAIIGSTEGTHFFRISEDDKLQELDFVQGRFSSTMVIHRDIKVYRNYAYAVCDEGESSLQIIDLSYLPDSVHVVADNDTNFARVHNLFIDDQNALMYVCSVTPKVGGVLVGQKSMEVYSLANPELPVLVYEGPNDIPEVHDAFVRNNIAYLNCGFDGLRVYDFTNPSSPVFIQNLTVYQDQGYNHQGWLSHNGSTYVFADETGGKRLKKCTVGAGHEITVKSYFGTNSDDNSVPHNVWIDDHFAYVAYYNEGLRIFDLRPQVPLEIAHYDTYPTDHFFNMNGAWGVFAGYSSGNIIVSDRQNGLFLFNFEAAVFSNTSTGTVSVYPNPVLRNAEFIVHISVPEVSNFEIDLVDLNGRIIEQHSIYNASYAKLKGPASQGLYFVEVKYDDYLGKPVKEKIKISVY